MITHFWVQITKKSIGTLYDFNPVESRSFSNERTETKAKPCLIRNLFYTDRSGINEMNKMEVCEDQKSEKWCKKQKKKGKCSKYEDECKKTCDLCDDQTDNCDDTLHQLSCLNKD